MVDEIIRHLEQPADEIAGSFWSHTVVGTHISLPENRNPLKVNKQIMTERFIILGSTRYPNVHRGYCILLYYLTIIDISILIISDLII